MTKDNIIPATPKQEKTLTTPVLGNSPMSVSLNNSLASFTMLKNMAIKNSQAENIISSAGVKPTIKKASRNNYSNTLMGLAKLQGFKGTKK
tara:strand:- start:239 stop:511 length:273 start_codon:yes stop_codon:yes gene_type:complete